MVYKIGNLADIKKLPKVKMDTWTILCHYASVLTNEYGADRNVDKDDGGYVLYATPGTDSEYIKAYFDYTKHTPEQVDEKGSLCIALYVLNNEFVVVIIMSKEDAPAEILNEID